MLAHLSADIICSDVQGQIFEDIFAPNGCCRWIIKQVNVIQTHREKQRKTETETIAKSIYSLESLHFFAGRVCVKKIIHRNDRTPSFPVEEIPHSRPFQREQSNMAKINLTNQI